jgi:hypothetical protein
MLVGLLDRIKKLNHDAQKAIVKSYLDVLPDTSFVDDQTQFERLMACEGCEEMNKETRRCKLCTCFIDEKTRVLQLPFMELEECPIKKW